MKDRTLRWLFTVPGKKIIYVFLLTLGQAVSGASGVLYALLLREIVNAATGGDRNGFFRNLLYIILLVAAQLVLRVILRYLGEISKSSIENTFKQRLVHTLLHRDYLRVNAVHSGEWMNRLTNDTVVITNAYIEIIPGLCGMIVKLFSAMIMIIAIEPRFAAILIPGGMLMILFTWFFRKIIKRLHKKVQEADGRMRIFMQERIANLLVIHSFAAEDKILKDAAKKMEDHKDARMRRMLFSNFCNFGLGLAMNGMYMIGIGWCGYGILTGTVSFGTLTAITQLITQIQAPFASISGYLSRYYTMLSSAERLIEVEDFAQDIESAKPLSEMREFYEKELDSFGLKDACFTYYPASEHAGELSKEGMPEVFEHLDLEIRKGQYVAFKGTSGCGKSTALRLLMCVYKPDGGKRIFTDRKGNTFDLTSAYRRLFAYVPQGNALMNGTIREVVSFADPESAFDEKRLQDALQIACADSFVSEQENGLDTMLGERGASLSEGQMQRLSIARAIFSESPILLLDEATSSLDAATEQKLLQNLRSMTDRTVVIVTHRPAALSICDRVFEFEENGVTCHDL